MEQNVFLKQAKERIMRLNEQSAKDCLLEIVRRMQQENQEEFLLLLTNYGGKKETSQANARSYQHRMSQEFVDEKIENFDSLFEQIEEEELSLEANGYEDYSEGYWDSSWVWEYYDPMHVCEKIVDAIHFAQDCVNDRRYQEAVSLFDKILEVEIAAVNDGDEMTVRLEEMADEGLLHVDLRELAPLILYADYQVQKPGERAKSIYGYFAYPFFGDIHIEEMLRMGREELQDIEQFWQDWIELLSEKSGDLEARLLSEAVLIYQGPEGILHMARQNADKHPSLYLSALEEFEKNHDYEKMEAAGAEAIDKLKVNLRIRGQIALKAAFAASCLGETEKTKAYWLEAYRSDSTVQNYLRLFAEKDCALTQGMEAKELFKSREKATNYICRDEEQRENIMDNRTWLTLNFFAGDFVKVKAACKNPASSLGWTGTFMEAGITLFLLYFNENKELGKGMTDIADSFSYEFGFSNKESLPLLGNVSRKEKQYTQFWQAFQNWRKYFPMDEKERKNIMSWIENIIHQRAQAIVGGQHRNQYGQVAKLVAALGEAKESRGETGAKQGLMSQYKREFPRHSAFHGEMREYGVKF